MKVNDTYDLLAMLDEKMKSGKIQVDDSFSELEEEEDWESDWEDDF